MRRPALAAAVIVATCAVVVALFVLWPRGGLSSHPVSSVPQLLSEPAGIPGAGLVLAPDGLGPVTFGDKEADAVAKLVALLGDPVEDSTEDCGSDGGGVRWVRWANLTVALQDGWFNGYISGIYFPPDSPEMMIKTVDGVGLRATVDELHSTYGDRFAWVGHEESFGSPVDAFGIDGFDVGQPMPTGLGGYVEGGREEGRVITFLAGQPCVDNGPPSSDQPGPTSGESASPSGLIAFHADPHGNSGLYVTNADGTGSRLVSGSLRGQPFGQWSPDGSEIAFLNGSFGVGRLTVVSADGSNERTVGSAEVSGFAWSPDGVRLAYEDADVGGVWIIGANGSGQATQLSATGHPSEWSPDGMWILSFDGPDGASNIYRIPASGGAAEQLIAGGNDFSPRWSLDGSQIAFTSSRDGNQELYLVAADGSGLRRLTEDPAPDDEAHFSPDGARLVYVSYRDGADPHSIGIGNAEVYVLDLRTGGSQSISNDPAWDGDPAWSPDGGWIAFTRRTDHGQLYVMRPDGSDQRMLPGFAAPEFNDCCPVWQPDPR
jgi:Tol biopolymer transport system component